MFKPQTTGKKSSRSNSLSKVPITNPQAQSLDLPTWQEATGDISIPEEKYCVGLNAKVPIVSSIVSGDGNKYCIGHSDGKIYFMNMRKSSATSLMGFNGHISNLQFGSGDDSRFVLACSSKNKAVKI